MTDTTNPQQAAVEERVARHLASKDWLTAADHWDRASAWFRADYLAHAREVIALVQAEPAVSSAPANRAAILLRDAESYLSALHGSVARHDNLAANYGCAGCELRDQITAALRAVATVPTSAPTDQAALRSDLEDALKGAGVYDSKERMWHSLSPEWIEEILTEVLAVLPAPAACSDPIECSHEAALGQADAVVARVQALTEEHPAWVSTALIHAALGGEA